MSRLTLVPAVICMTLAGSALAQPAAGPRLKTFMLDYVAPGAVSAPIAVIRSILNDGARFLNDQLVASTLTPGNFGYLKMEIVEGVSGEDPKTLWQDENALQVLSGRIAVKNGDPNGLTVTTDAYLGSLAAGNPNLTREEVRIQSDFSYANYEIVADTHHLVMIYALLIDAMEKGQPQDVVAAIRQAACFAASDLQARNSLHDDLKSLASHLEMINPGCIQ